MKDAKLRLNNSNNKKKKKKRRENNNIKQNRKQCNLDKVK